MQKQLKCGRQGSDFSAFFIFDPYIFRPAEVMSEKRIKCGQKSEEISGKDQLPIRHLCGMNLVVILSKEKETVIVH